LNGHRIGDPSRVFSKAGSAIQVVAEDHHASCEAAALCTRFLVSLSHQMRTQLNSIVSATEMMVASELSLDSEMSASHQDFVATIAESANALSHITDGIADFSRCLAVGAGALAYQSELDDLEHGASPLDANAMGDYAAASGIGAEEMPSKNPATGNRAFSGAANFRTRVPPDTAKQIRILLAEDHLMNQHVMLRMLARLGYTADAVCNGAEAVAALTRSPYDIVLMDCQMPELDGYEATRQIRKNGGRFRSTPIIAVTANAMEGDREKCLDSGMSDYMSKPVLAQTLATTLEKWILPDEGAGSPASAQAPPQAARKTARPPADKSQAESQMADAGSAKIAPPEAGDAVDAGAIETLRSMDSGDEGFIGKIIELFLSDLTERVAALKAATQIRDGHALKAIAHALKGSCGHFGARNLAALCRKMEQIGVQQPVGDPTETLSQLEAEADRVRIALQAVQRTSLPNSMRMEEPD
jgi:CheY-like chemotaxis protein/HPt (histidine-containing phosphotransfer) domain-containing protein